ncbi:hypothetical protein EVAR_102462_1 [Eumeta japonica]|uniref:Endonuclease/exonuclease/phosphatase domain-containing protein n=1 Tax=Eumeta variegata TaxID=151549 RepID=A0A4C1ZS49_EUMVA|nr:hypothetical protein EVAR_102462_1 [Eumeta japonica]
MAEGLSAEENTGHVSLRFIQSNLQRSKLATSELLVEADRRRIAVALVQEPYVGSIGELRRYQDAESSKGDSAKGTRQSRHHSPGQWRGRRGGSDPHRRKRHGCRNRSRKLQDWRCVGVFRRDMPIGPYLDRVRYVCSKLGTDKIILGRRQRVERGDRLFRSVVDVTACGSALLDRVEEWQVVRDVTSSDHNAVTFAVRMGKRSGPRPHRYTGLQYSKGSMVRVRSSHGCCSR